MKPDPTELQVRSGTSPEPADPHRTRTADHSLFLAGAAELGGENPAKLPHSNISAQPTAILSCDSMDGAAISFARERERALARLDHSASVARLRRALTIGIPVWFSALLLDVFVTQIAGDGDLAVFVSTRVLGGLVASLVIWRLRREPEPSVRLLWFLDMLAFTTVSAVMTVSCLVYRGIESPYGASIVLILLARGATTLAPWQHGAWLFAAPALAYPIVLLIAAQLDQGLALQFRDPHAQGFFATLMFMITVSWAMLVLGGHFAWRLRREAVETRNIGRYKLLRRLGAGGGGAVWAAFDVTLRQRVALKTVSGHLPGSQVLARLEREVRALSELTHPNTVRVFDYGVTDDGLWYYAMELLHGQNLRELIVREGPLSIERVSSIARQVLRALGEAHDKGIIHRDVKPENVFVAHMGGDAEVIKLLDFGIARTSYDTKLTHTGFVAGTPAYMAPETILGHAADVRSDIYSFGATLYFAITGHLPFPDEDPAALFAAHVSRPLGRMSMVSALPIPLSLEHLVARCMAKNPADRYPSTHAVLEALQLIGAERPLQA